MASNYVNDYKIFMINENGQEIPVEMLEIVDWSEVLSDEVIEAWYGFPHDIYDCSFTVHADNETCLEFSNMMLELEKIELERQIKELKEKIQKGRERLLSINELSVEDCFTAYYISRVVQEVIDELA